MSRPKKNEQLILFREAKERGEAVEKGKMLPHFQRCGFPLQKPPADYLTHTRHDGDIKITITANGEYGMPYGADVLTLLWCFSAAIKQKRREIRFRFGSKLLREMGLPPNGRNYRALVASFKRIYGATYFFDWKDSSKSYQGKRHNLIDEYRLWFSEDENDDSAEAVQNRIILSEFAWDWLNRCPWIEVEPAYTMRQTPGAIQLYFAIANRAPRLRGPGDLVDIPLTGPDGLDKQLGGAIYTGYEGQKRWRQLLRTWLAQIRVGWPKCPAELVDLTDTPYGKSSGKRGWHLRISWCEPSV